MSVRVGIVGVGNCASALVQGATYYAKEDGAPGLMSADVDGLGPGDVEFSAAFDVASSKVGRDLSEAIGAEPNDTRRFTDVPYLDVTVIAGPRLDGIGRVAESRLSGIGVAAVDGTENVVEHLRATRTDVLVNFMPVGSEQASEWYAGAALEAGCAFVNAIPTRIARDVRWQRRFSMANLPLLGDDVKSQFGATIVHRVLAELLSDRGIRLDRTYQLNVGGNMDFLNMLQSDRLEEKRESKTSAVVSAANGGEGLAPDDVRIGPSDYVRWLGDRKVAFIRLEGSAFGGAPLEVELRMQVWDSPNSAGVVIDAVRYAKAALRRGEGGPLIVPSAWMMKAPPEQMDEAVALEALRLLDLRYAADV